MKKNWEVKNLESIIDRMSNGANVKQSDIRTETPISRIETIWNESIDWNRVKYINGYDDSFLEKYQLKKGDILFSHINSDSHLGKTALYKNENRTLIHGVNLLLIRLNDSMCPEFIYYQFKYKRKNGEFISIAQKSVNQSSINQQKLKRVKFSIPDISIQHIVVSKIEELFSELDKGVEELKTTQAQLKVYRQSVLKWAFEGKLTNENLKDGELPKDWKAANLKDIADVNPKLPNKENLDQDLEIQFLPMKLVEEIKNVIHLDETKKLHEVQKGSYTPFINGDIIVAKVTPCMENGKFAIVNNLKNGIGYGSSEFHVIRSNSIVKEFLFFYLIQDKYRNEAANAMTGAVGLRRVPKQFIENTEIPIPDIKEQQQIVLEIEKRLSLADQLEKTIEEQLVQAEALRQSILKKAFEGGLV